jgi:putative transposase
MRSRSRSRAGGLAPRRVQEALGELVGTAKAGLLALSVGVRLGVLEEFMAGEVDDVVVPKGRLSTYEHFADRDPLGRVMLERMLAGVSTRRYRRTQEPVGEQVEVRVRGRRPVRGVKVVREAHS